MTSNTLAMINAYLDGGSGSTMEQIILKQAYGDIVRLTAERDAALKEIERLQDVCGDSADRMVALCKERDDARIEVCRLLARNRTEGTDESEPGFHATARGWNCFYDESFDDVSGD